MRHGSEIGRVSPELDEEEWEDEEEDSCCYSGIQAKLRIIGGPRRGEYRSVVDDEEEEEEEEEEDEDSSPATTLSRRGDCRGDQDHPLSVGRFRTKRLVASISYSGSSSPSSDPNKSRILVSSSPAG